MDSSFVVLSLFRSGERSAPPGNFVKLLTSRSHLSAVCHDGLLRHDTCCCNRQDVCVPTPRQVTWARKEDSLQQLKISATESRKAETGALDQRRGRETIHFWAGGREGVMSTRTTTMTSNDYDGSVTQTGRSALQHVAEKKGENKTRALTGLEAALHDKTICMSCHQQRRRQRQWWWHGDSESPQPEINKTHCECDKRRTTHHFHLRTWWAAKKKKKSPLYWNQRAEWRTFDQMWEKLIL